MKIIRHNYNGIVFFMFYKMVLITSIYHIHS